MKSRLDLQAILLWNIRSSHNVGAIFRTAEGAGIKNLILIGHTPTPIDKFGRPNKQIEKTALGAEKMISWQYFKNFSTALGFLEKKGLSLVGLENDSKAKNIYHSFDFNEPAALIVGEETKGLSPAVRKKCKFLLSIPMLGKKESLNVSVATGIAIYEIFFGK